MTEANPELLPSLGKLARGLSALFWGLPAALIICAETARAEWLQPLGIIPAIVVNALLFYGLMLMSAFQKQERPWHNVLDRTKLAALINLGLCPFLFWFSRMPQQPFFRDAVVLLVFSALLFLFNLNLALKKLGDMLPDETLRHETRAFTLLNRWLLAVWLLLVIVFGGLAQWTDWPAHLDYRIWILVQKLAFVLFLFLGLAPLAITMALLWKTKETILNSVFAANH